jgi:hypothetical protein
MTVLSLENCIDQTAGVLKTSGSTTPVEKAIITISGAVAVSGDNTLLAAQTGFKIVISSVILQSESTTATLMKLTDGASGTVLVRCLGQNQGDGVAMVYQSDARKKGTASTALILNLGGANSCGYTIGYYLEAA